MVGANVGVVGDWGGEESERTCSVPLTIGPVARPPAPAPTPAIPAPLAPTPAPGAAPAAASRLLGPNEEWRNLLSGSSTGSWGCLSSSFCCCCCCCCCWRLSTFLSFLSFDDDDDELMKLNRPRLVCEGLIVVEGGGGADGARGLGGEGGPAGEGKESWRGWTC